MVITPVFFSAFSLPESTRGNSKYHYYGIRVKPDSPLNRLQEDTQYMAMRQQPVHQKQRSALHPRLALFLSSILILSLAAPLAPGSPRSKFFPFTRNNLTFSPLIKITVKMTFSPSHFLSILPVISLRAPHFTFCLFPSRSRVLLGLAARNSHPPARPALWLEHMILFSCGCGNTGSRSSVFYFSPMFLFEP